MNTRPNPDRRDTHFASMLSNPEAATSRRAFLKFMGRTGALATGVAGLSLLPSCAHSPESGKTEPLPFPALRPSAKDDLLLAEGFQYRVMLKWGDQINIRGDQFGYNNDYIAVLPTPNEKSDEAIMWVNHEYTHPLFVSDYQWGSKKNKAQVHKEMKSVGGSIVKIKKTKQGWQMSESAYNRRLDAFTKIPLVSSRPIAGSKIAMGTFANCSGGFTPWNTFLTAEENYHNFYGEVDMEDKRKRKVSGSDEDLQWDRFYQNSPEHYGWITEVEPYTGKAKKLTALGRFSHECATVREGAEGRCVVYTGDDKNSQCLYKFIADKPGSLETGKLYAADTEKGRWIPLDIAKHSILQKHFNDQMDVLIFARKAALMVGGTPLDRPEDIEIDPKTQAVYCTLTNNKPKGNHFGSILKIEEKDNDPFALEFKASTFLAGGPDSQFAAPDNITFDRNGNLWMTTDMSGGAMHKEPYTQFGNNGLFYIPMSGPHAGTAIQVASAPTDAELTGPCFAPDGRSLFLSVQHPGEKSKSLTKLTSRWPEGGTPKPAVVEITGPMMDRLLG